MKQYGYGRQSVDFADCWAVLKVLKSNFLTGGPKIKEFEDALCAYTGARYCVSVSSATAGLHLAMLALNIESGDEIITSPLTFLASANCVLYGGGTVRFADIEKDTANISPVEIVKQITPRTKGIIPVHFAGQSCAMEKIYGLAKEHNLFVVEDAAHAIGSEYQGKKVGSCEFSDMTVFSFHPVKTITTGEGGAITTNNKELYEKLVHLRSHGLYHTQNWEYEMRDLGFNYRLNDMQAALGLSQLQKLERFKKRRREIVRFYNENLGLPHLAERDFSNACFHLYPVLVEKRKEFYQKAQKNALNLQVHYIPVHTQPYYRGRGFKIGDFPNAEEFYSKSISLPLHSALTDRDLREIVKRVKSIL
ncbi:UDP-4-amino-4,6-dideoxy-N-acetyl-beta-L-altrosamine transaminase [Candidatus Termititenax persephonae]|uniref:UDP-4-amino-4, 6-dideoxy-N-acetyl-beta-L-altrosamine transaminase n=1 Tax=Candidatus Termititenax persephonae TaxID=2218525 RepID=A0A388THF7_9BACT|nr:UDP-4-amino-4,6-dideoxy-N-acetyl-beta-L-altrosamine transaminase [Candidatus Termititenax persephonae]